MHSDAALSRNAPVGYLVRQVHHWSAVTFVAAILLHMARIFFTAAFRKPRELNWVVGFLLLVFGFLAGFTGYSLPFDSLSGTGLRIAESVLLSIPLVGGWAADVFTGGGFPGPSLLQHLYTLHVFFLPSAIALLLSLHLGMMVYQKHTQFVRDEGHVVGRRFWPDYALRTLAAFGFSTGVMLALAASIEINGIQAYGPYNDWTVPNPAAPDWYAAFLDGALRLGPAWEPRIAGHPIAAVFWPGVVLPSLVLAFIGAWPWLDAYFSRDRAAHNVLVPPTFAPWRVGVGCALIFAGLVLTLAAGDDQQAFTLHVPVRNIVTFYRFMLLFGSAGAGLLGALVARGLRAHAERAGGRLERVVTLRRMPGGGHAAEAPQPGEEPQAV